VLSAKPILPYPRHPVEYQPYDPRAPIVAEIVGDLIRQSLPTVNIEHIGSTAVPGCAGRGAIDLMALYPDEPIETILTELDALGFEWVQRVNALPDEWPKGAGAIEYDGSIFRIHIHVLPHDHPAVHERIAFRDKLRIDPALRAEYMRHKQSILNSGITDPIAYTAAKSDFVSHAMNDIVDE
jgi:GrpB-like predicted nucleotidyltransferase (UPF0157 family)